MNTPLKTLTHAFLSFLFCLSILIIPLQHTRARQTAPDLSPPNPFLRPTPIPTLLDTPTTTISPTQYTITDLGIFMYPLGLNNQGQVVGNGNFALQGGTCLEPALWDEGNLIRLGTFGGECGSAVDINENGQIAGYADDGVNGSQAFFWNDANGNGLSDPGELVGLGSIGGSVSKAYAINDAGVVVGRAVVDDDTEVNHAFRWAGGSITDIHPGNTEDASWATDINNAGVIVGLEQIPSEPHWRAVKWDNGTVAQLGGLGIENGAHALNDLSQITGYITPNSSDPLTMFLWLPDTAYGLPAGMNNLALGAGSEDYYDINDQGQIIGTAPYPYLWQAGTVTNLNDLLPPDSGWTLYTATGINDKGQIIGQGVYQGQTHGYMLTPRPWTLLFYLAGDNDLDDSYPPIFQRLEAAANLPGVTILVFWDSSGASDSAYYEVQYDTDLTQFATYTEGVNTWSLGEVNTGSPLTLSDFILWGVQRSPTAHYALILDDHGNGLGGLAWDDTNNKDRITLPELKLALNTAYEQTQRKMDVLYMAMCLMGMLEDAYQVRGFADYYVASENLQTTYQNYLTGFSADLSPAQAAVTFATAYANEMNTKGYAYTISTVDLSQLDPLVVATNDLGIALATPMGTISGTITTVANLVQRYDNKAPSKTINANDTYVDLYDFADLVEQNLGNEAEIVTAAQAVKTALSNYVMYESHASGTTYNLNNSSGVSIFFPATASSFYTPDNYDFAVGADWGTALRPYTPTLNTSWASFLVDYFHATQPGGPDDPTPPEPLAKITPGWVLFLPALIR